MSLDEEYIKARKAYNRAYREAESQYFNEHEMALLAHKAATARVEDEYLDACNAARQRFNEAVARADAELVRPRAAAIKEGEGG